MWVEAAKASVKRIAGGDLGSFQTISQMRQLVNASLVDPVVIETARSIVVACPSRDLTCRAVAVRDWLADHFQFIHDPNGVELLSSPRYMLDKIAARGYAQGDCDDVAILGAALGKAVGLRARFVLAGFEGPRGPFRHVFCILRGLDSWYSLDVTKPQRPMLPIVNRTEQREV